MIKRIISLTLALVMLAASVLLTSCSNETEIEEEPAKIYSLYTICEPGTTELAKKQVELALNRLLFNEKKLCIKLIMVTEDEYEDLIAQKFDECKKYDEERKNKNKNKNKNNSEAESSAESSVVSENSLEALGGEDGIFTGDEYLDFLQENLDKMERGVEYLEIEFDAPRLDIFLVLGYEKYIDLVGKDLLAAIDDKLTSEAKIIRDYVYPTFLDAAKVTNSKGTRKTYGVPMNKGIGEYEYIVFDKEYLDKYSIDAGTMTNLEDLEYYLEILAENEPDIVPLANVFDSPEFAYLFEKGFTAYIGDKHVINTYDDSKALAYYTMIARYHTMGYLKDDPGDTGWAVKFVKGTNADLEALAGRTGREYDYTIHSYPVASNEDLLGALFCVSAYTVSNELTDVMKILAYLESNISMANTLAYGVEGEHYTLNEDTMQIKPISQDYKYNRDYVGNTFLTYTLEGENPNKWEQLKMQNRDSSKTAEQSVSVGFAYYPVAVKDPNDTSITYSEPNYIEIIQEYVDKFYPSIIKGDLVDINFEELKVLVTPTITDEQIQAVKDRYTNELNNTVKEEQAARYAEGTKNYNTIATTAYENAFKYFYKSKQKAEVKKRVKEEVKLDPEYNSTPESIDARVNEICTEEYMTEQVKIIYADDIAARAQTTIENSVTKGINDGVKKYMETEEYAARLEEALNSPACVAEIDEINAIDVFVAYPEVALNNSKIYLQEQLKEKINAEFEEMNKALRKAYKEFADSYMARYDFADDEKRSEPDFRKAIIDTVSTRLRNLLKAELRRMVTAELGEGALPEDISDTVEERFTDTWIQDVIMETFELNKDPSKTFEEPASTEALREIVNAHIKESDVKTNYENSLLATFEKSVGLIKTVDAEAAVIVDDDDESGETSAEETSAEEGTTPSESETDPDSGEIVDLETVDLYNVIFKKRIEAQYYKYAPLPTA